ncbi:Vam6/Vps39-like protein [Tanacetum coccineum]
MEGSRGMSRVSVIDFQRVLDTIVVLDIREVGLASGRACLRVCVSTRRGDHLVRVHIPLDSSTRETAAVLDMTLLQALLLLLTGQSTADLDLLKSLNYCDVKICEEILLNGNRYLCLSGLYKYNSLHREALKLLHHIEVADVNVLIANSWLGVQAV